MRSPCVAHGGLIADGNYLVDELDCIVLDSSHKILFCQQMRRHLA